MSIPMIVICSAWSGEAIISSIWLFPSDYALPFGLRSAPFIFYSIADLLEWILKHNYGMKFLLHYLDDFHTLGPPNSSVWPEQPGFVHSAFWGLGYPPSSR